MTHDDEDSAKQRAKLHRKLVSTENQIANAIRQGRSQDSKRLTKLYKKRDKLLEDVEFNS